MYGESVGGIVLVVPQALHVSVEEWFVLDSVSILSAAVLLDVLRWVEDKACPATQCIKLKSRAVHDLAVHFIERAFVDKAVGYPAKIAFANMPDTLAERPSRYRVPDSVT